MGEIIGCTAAILFVLALVAGAVLFRVGLRYSVGHVFKGW
jgi:hypothetical protein